VNYLRKTAIFRLKFSPTSESHCPTFLLSTDPSSSTIGANSDTDPKPKIWHGESQGTETISTRTMSDGSGEPKTWDQNVTRRPDRSFLSVSIPSITRGNRHEQINQPVAHRRNYSDPSSRFGNLAGILPAGPVDAHRKLKPMLCSRAGCEVNSTHRQTTASSVTNFV
jgi:hypothetical protein